MSNYTSINLGSFKEIAKLENGKAFLHDILNLTSCEISINVVPKDFKVPFNHKHKENEEIYIIIGGEGIITVSDEEIKVKEGSAVRISPNAKRTIRNNGSNELLFICVQAKENSLKQFGFGDGEIC